MDKHASRSRLTGIARIVFWNLFWIGCGVLLLEVLYGSWLSNDPMRLLYLERKLIAHYRVLAPEIKPQHRDVTYRRDRWGLRGYYGAPEDIDILTIGGSTTDQRYITEGKTWQDVLQNRFISSGRDIRVANAGVSGRTTFGHLRDFDAWFPNIKGLKPRYVLFYVGVNDMFFDRPSSSDQTYRDEAWLNDFKQWIRNSSATYYVYRALLGIYLASTRDLAHSSLDYRNGVWVDQPVRSDYDTVLRPRLEAFRTRLAELGGRVKQWGATPIFVTQPRGDSLVRDGKVFGLVKTQSRIDRIFHDDLLGTLDQDTGNGVDYFMMLSLFNAVTLEVCENVGGICIDLAGELKFSIGDFYDHVHNTVTGSSKIGEYLFDTLRARIQQTP